MKSLTTCFTFAATLATRAQALGLDSSIQLSTEATAELTAETTAQVSGKKWKSGEVMTHETYQYGKFIAKIKGDDKLGTCTSFFTFWKGDPVWSKAKWSEIDIELVPSAHHGTYSTNIIWAGEQMNAWQADRETIADPGDGWAVYEFQWTPDYISWLYNGKQIRKVKKSDNNPEIEYMTRRQHLMMNFWLPNFPDWNEGFNPVDMPWYARYDYVEYWEYVKEADWPHTEGANQWHPFKKVWRDEFDTFDTNRWKKSDDWTFGVNDVTFWASQVYTEDSTLVLKMEPRDAAGDDGDGNAGGNEGGGSTDGTCDCQEYYEDLKDTIARLEEELHAFTEAAGTCGGDGGSGGDGTNGGGDGGSTGGGDDGGSTGGGDGGSTGGGDGGSTGGGDGGSTGGGDGGTDNNFDLHFTGYASEEQLSNVKYHANHNSVQNYKESKLRFINKAEGPIWINYQAKKMKWPQTLRIDKGKIMDFKVPENEYISATRFWPKYQCNEHGQNCAFGESGGPGLDCPEGGCSPPIDTKFEATFGADHNLDWYNASQVDGWTLPYDMKFDCRDGSEGSADLNCSGLTQDACPTQDLYGVEDGFDVDLTAFNPKFDNQYGGCYSPCAKLTYRNWNNPIAEDNSPSYAPADKYCCGGIFDTPGMCWEGPDPDMEYTRIVHKHCDTYAWAYDDAVGLKACKSDKVTFMVTFYEP